MADLSTYEGRQAARDAGYWVGSEGGEMKSEYLGTVGGSAAPGAAMIGGGGTYAGAGGGGGGGGAQQLSAGIDSLLGAIASGNKAAFDEAIRQFNVTFGLDEKKFGEAVRQFNEGLGISQAGLTGQYQGAPTLAAQQQQYAQQMGMIKQAADLQANPFRQQQALGQMNRLLGGQGVPGFQSPNTVTGVGTAGGNTQGGLGYLSQMIEDIRNPTANTASMNEVMNAIPTPTKLNSVEFLRAAPSTQSMVLQGMTEKYGLDPQDALRQIQQTLPQFTSPTAMGTIKR